MKERIIIVLIAVVFGLAATTLGYFIYQSAKSLPEDTLKPTTKKTTISPTPIDTSNIYLTVSTPKANSITPSRTIQIKGKTNSNNTLIVSTNQADVVAAPTTQGDFAVSITIDAGTNRVITRAIAPSGEEKVDTRTVSFTTEDF